MRQDERESLFLEIVPLSLFSQPSIAIVGFVAKPRCLAQVVNPKESIYIYIHIHTHTRAYTYMYIRNVCRSDKSILRARGVPGLNAG